MSDPFVPLEGAGNFRDAGGLATTDGRRVRTGLLYRSNRLSRLTAADHAVLAPLGITRIFDLRERGERARSPTDWPGPEIVFWSDRDAVQPWSETILGYPQDEAGMRCFLADLYAELPFAFAPRIADMVRSIATDEGGCVVHCAAGKDRTGVVIGLLLALGGVDRDAIVAEYLLTNGRVGIAADQHKAYEERDDARPDRVLSAEAMQALLSADASFLDAAFAAIEAQHGTLDAYARDALGLTQAELSAYRQALIEG